MLDHLKALTAVLAGGTACAAATVIRVSGSVPRPVGTSMLVAETGALTGSLSGGCVEGAVVEAAQAAIRDGRTRTEAFGYSDTDAFAVGLSCGGTIEVLIQPFHPPGDPRALPGASAPPRPRGSGGGTSQNGASQNGASQNGAASLIRRLGAPGGGFLVEGSHDAAGLRRLIRERLPGLLPDAAAADPQTMAGSTALLVRTLTAGRTGIIRQPGGDCRGGELEFLVESRLPAPALYLLGGNDFSAALSRLGRMLGYRVSVCDARPAFTDPERFPGAAEVTAAWPDAFLRGQARSGKLDARSVVCVLTHDAKFDVPVLAFALQHELAYVGAMGSRRSHQARLAGLRAAGLSEQQLSRLHSPIGLDIGALTPEDVAVSIMAEVIAARTRTCTALSLAAVAGPVHHAEYLEPSPAG